MTTPPPAEVVERAPPRDAAAEAAARQGDSYVVAQDARAAFRRDGYVRLPGVLSEAELAPIELLYQDLVDGKHGAAAGVRFGADRADHSLPAGTPEEKWRMVNVALPTHYCAPLLGNLFERRAASIARQLLGDREGPDQGGGGHIIKSYDQLLAKRPRRPDAQFNMHQDMGFWWMPENTTAVPTCTATVSLALNDAHARNGCLRVVPGSGAREVLRTHRDVIRGDGGGDGGKDGEAHGLLEIGLREDERVHAVEVLRGGVTVHNEWIVHGSGGNETDGWRHTYVCAFRDERMVAYERARGFRHSYNDTEALQRLRDHAQQRLATAAK